MNVLLTGAFGNIGGHALGALLKNRHQVRALDVRTPANRRIAKQWESLTEVIWGDLRHQDDLSRAVQGADAVIHLAFIIPPASEEKPEWAEAINVGGTRNLIAAMQAQPTPPRLIFASTTWIHRYVHDRQGVIGVDEPINPIDYYGRHKVACEQLIRESGLSWTVLRLGTVTPFRQPMDNGSSVGIQLLFRAPLRTRLEMVDPRDAATAFANAVDCDECLDKILLIGGGQTMQIVYRDYFRITLGSIGIGMLPETAFSADQPIAGDWMDTTESQRLLDYQHHTLQDWLAERNETMAWQRRLTRPVSPLIRRWLVGQSPYYRKAN
jgi:nucleoside-diphosphate-sugar epimerase